MKRSRCWDPSTDPLFLYGDVKHSTIERWNERIDCNRSSEWSGSRRDIGQLCYGVVPRTRFGKAPKATPKPETLHRLPPSLPTPGEASARSRSSPTPSRKKAKVYDEQAKGPASERERRSRLTFDRRRAQLTKQKRGSPSTFDSCVEKNEAFKMHHIQKDRHLKPDRTSLSVLQIRKLVLTFKFLPEPVARIRW